MSFLIPLVFAATYLGMAAGRVPGLKLDRTGLALIGLAVLLLFSGEGTTKLFAAVDVPTLLLLFSLMILSAQFGAARLYEWCVARIVGSAASPRRLLAMTVVISGGLSAVLANDIVVFAIVPLMCFGLKGRGLDPRPYLLGVAGAANAGSAATLIGNPQNILIGQLGHLDFWEFLKVCGLPAVLSLVIVYGVIAYVWRRELGARPEPPVLEGVLRVALDRGQIIKGIAAILLLLGLFASPLPRDISAFSVAAFLLASRRLEARELLKTVDWNLLILIVCLFAITGAFARTGLPQQAINWLSLRGLLPDHLMLLAPLTLFLSNTIGNVPAVTLLMSVLGPLPHGLYYALALLSTLAGNFLIVGSLANLIVAIRSEAAGVKLTFGDFARAGIPLTLLSMGLASAWLAAGGWIG